MCCQALFSPMVVDAVSFLDPQLLDINLVSVQHTRGMLSINLTHAGVCY